SARGRAFRADRLDPGGLPPLRHRCERDRRGRRLRRAGPPDPASAGIAVAGTRGTHRAYTSFNVRASCQPASAITSMPTEIISARADRCLTDHPPSGAAIRPPNTSGAKCHTGDAPSSTKKVVAAAIVTKNSVVLTEPTVMRGAWPEPTRVEVATGPQPPPPLASRKAATKPSGGIHRAGASRGGAIRQALNRMKTPMATR